MARLGWRSFLCLWLLLNVGGAAAQALSGAFLFPPDMDAFPRLELYFDVHNERGEFIHGVQAGDVRVWENGAALPVLELSELRPGVQVVFVLNPGDSFDIHNSQGISRYDFVAETLTDWARSRQGSTIDDLGLLISTGVEHSHFTDPLELMSALAAYVLDTTSVPPGLEVLNRAVDLAADQTPRPGMEKVILFITSPLQGDLSFGLQNLAARANQERVHIFIWLVASPQFLESSNATMLATFAQQTGGQLVAFSGEGLLPDPESYLSPRRDIYRLVFDSRITAGGEQRLKLDILLQDQVITTPELVFEFDLRPPNPAFISPVVEIQRALPADAEPSLAGEIDPDELSPQAQKLQVLFDFPDGRPRPLVRSALYVDDVLAAENHQPPFDQFSWDLSQYLENGQHILQVEAVDNLGLSGRSAQLPVEVIVTLPRVNPFRAVLRNWPALAGFVAVLAFSAWLLMQVLRGRIRPQILGMAKGLQRGRRWLADVSHLTTAFADGRRMAGQRERRAPAWANRLNWPQRRLLPKAEALLLPLFESADRPPASPISIVAQELTLGRDPGQAIIAIDDPSLDGLHARLVLDPAGAFLITDQGSVAGTLVNYLPVSPAGQALQDGDLVYLGRVGFRFTEQTPRRVRKIFVQEGDLL